MTRPGPKLKPGPRNASGRLVHLSTGVLGRGGYKAARVVCIHGHAALDSRPDRPTNRQCRACARIRAEEQAEAIRQARDCLGLLHKDYIALHGMSTRKALELLAQCEASRQRQPVH